MVLGVIYKNKNLKISMKPLTIFFLPYTRKAVGLVLQGYREPLNKKKIDGCDKDAV